MFGFMLLYYFCSTAGFVMVVGGIWLLYTQKIYIDRESGQITEIKTPVGTFRTNVPALALFALGFVPLIYPIYVLRTGGPAVIIRGNVKANAHPVLVYAVVRSESLLDNGEFSIPLPLLNNNNTGDYKIVYAVQNKMVQDVVDLKDLKNGEVILTTKDIEVPEPVTYRANISPIPAGFQ